MRTCLSRILADCRGAVLIEFTFIMPVLLLLFVVFAEMGSVLRQHQIVTEGVRDAARYLSRVPDPSDAAAQTIARNIALTASTDGSAPARSAFWTAPADVVIALGTVDNAGGALRGPATLQVITVSTQVAVDVPLVGPILRLIGGDSPASITVTAADQVRYFGT